MWSCVCWIYQNQNNNNLLSGLDLNPINLVCSEDWHLLLNKTISRRFGPPLQYITLLLWLWSVCAGSFYAFFWFPFMIWTVYDPINLCQNAGFENRQKKLKKPYLLYVYLPLRLFLHKYMYLKRFTLAPPVSKVRKMLQFLR